MTGVQTCALPIYVTDKYPEMKDQITDALSGDVNKDFTELFSRFAEVTEVPDELPYGAPKMSTPQHVAA